MESSAVLRRVESAIKDWQGAWARFQNLKIWAVQLLYKIKQIADIGGKTRITELARIKLKLWILFFRQFCATETCPTSAGRCRRQRLSPSLHFFSFTNIWNSFKGRLQVRGAWGENVAQQSEKDARRADSDSTAALRRRYGSEILTHCSCCPHSQRVPLQSLDLTGGPSPRPAQDSTQGWHLHRFLFLSALYTSWHVTPVRTSQTRLTNKQKCGFLLLPCWCCCLPWHLTVASGNSGRSHGAPIVPVRCYLTGLL